MSKKPVLEDVDDIDNMDMDIAEFDPSLKTPIAPVRPAPSVVRSQDTEPPLFPNLPMMNPLGDNFAPPPPTTTQRKDILDPSAFTEEEKAKFKQFRVVYPCYFDKNRSVSEGRRVSSDRAVANPLAKTISDACRSFGIPTLLELDKTHPQDFGNPGRVRVMLKDDVGTFLNPEFKHKRHLFNAISDYLKTHPTTLESVGPRGGIAYPAEFDGRFTPEEIPKVKGFRMNTIVPIHSQLVMKHPMTKAIYDPEVEMPKQPAVPKQPKKKIMKIRG
ncbi:hypothetical protein DIURU_001241 [Diutina rugosa]|uniref:Signal recognition particle SEC65 subunit n=1 Tax=Diutina rugosa TaxID=5481 RepID=A0A642UZW9_DIURU|nr:uncharacterized protein DIURU_001241 [Diutina rugosa]KAA8906059.1 hypothetical protein DIURU_001241 [Diutina rugosa]